MTPEQYKQKSKELKAEYESKQFEIDRQYAMSNCPAKHGDTLEDHHQKIEYVRHTIVRPSYYQKFPALCFYGPKLKKDGNPFKSREEAWLYQSNLKKVNWVPI